MQRLLFNPMSNVLINKYFDGNANIKVLEDIRFCDDIDDFFDNHDHVIIFLRNRDGDIGHWVCIVRNNAVVYYFDSYGKPPIKILKDINPNLLEYGELMNRLIKQKYDYYYNIFDYQDGKNENISTCGRYCVLVCIMNKTYANFNLEMFHELIYKMCKERKLSPDEAVIYFINKYDSTK